MIVYLLFSVTADKANPLKSVGGRFWIIRDEAETEAATMTKRIGHSFVVVPYRCEKKVEEEIS